MSVRIVFTCAGERPPGSGQRCRAFHSVPLVEGFSDPVGPARDAAEAAGWTFTRGHRCPACSRVLVALAERS